MKMKASTLYKVLPAAALAVMGLVIIPAWGDAQPAGVRATAAPGPDRIEGVWNARVNITVCETGAIITSFDAMAAFGRGGLFHDTNSMNPVLLSASFGEWHRIGKNRYEFAFRSFSFDPAGIHLGSRVVRHEVVLAKNGRTYTSQGTAEFYDIDGNLFMTGCSDATASRFE